MYCVAMHTSEEMQYSIILFMLISAHATEIICTVIVYLLNRMNEFGIHPSENKVYFGQLLGMCDQISFPLGKWLKCPVVESWSWGTRLYRMKVVWIVQLLLYSCFL